MSVNLELFCSLSLCIGILGSLLVLWLELSRRQRGAIEQYELVDSPFLAMGTTLRNGSGGDYSADIIQPEDTEDGVIVDDDSFWSTVHHKKICMVVILTAICLLEATPLFWTSTRLPHFWGIFIDAIFSLYLLGLGWRWSLRNTSHKHTTLQPHIIALVTTATIMSFVALSTNSTSITVAKNLKEWQRRLKWTTAFFYAITSGISFSIPRGPGFYYSHKRVYPITGSEDTALSKTDENVCRSISGSLWGNLIFSYTHSVLALGKTLRGIEVKDLPVLPADTRAPYNYARAKVLLTQTAPSIFTSMLPSESSGYTLGRRIISINAVSFTLQFVLAVLSAVTNYGPAWFLQVFVKYLETPIENRDMHQGWVYVAGLTSASVISVLISQQLWKVSTNDLEIQIRLQLNSMLYAKTLVRKDITSASAASNPVDDDDDSIVEASDDFSSKTQVMTLMTADADRVCDFAWHIFTLIDSPIEILVGLTILYNLLGTSCIVGISTLAVIIPLNHLVGKTLIRTQENLMETRDERVGVMNEILAGIRMIKFMAWERSFSKKVLDIRDKELKYQKETFIVEILWTLLWSASPIIVILATFYHFSIFRKQDLTPSIAFPSIIVFSTLKYALNALPETFAKMMQSWVSLRRIAKYLESSELPIESNREAYSTTSIAFENCTVTWPQLSPSSSPIFSLSGIDVAFPLGKLTFVCGKVGSGKTLLLLALLGEAEILKGNVLCPRTPPNFQSLAYKYRIAEEDWIVEGVCAYVPQTAWLRNASIRENILFNLPYNHSRYRKTLEACALVSDLRIFEDGDHSEIGESGVNLSGGQKARVSLARAIYSRASVLFLDDVLSAVDAHTADHIYQECLKGDLMRGRTAILVSHHIRLCASGADHVVALDHGQVKFQGPPESFLTSEFGNSLMLSAPSDLPDIDLGPNTPNIMNQKFKVPSIPDRKFTGEALEAILEASEATLVDPEDQIQKSSPRRFVEEELRAVGSIKNNVWYLYIRACGSPWYWSLLSLVMVAAAMSPVLENTWLRRWASRQPVDEHQSQLYYIGVYAGISIGGVLIGGLRWLVLYYGSLRASRSLYSKLLESILFATIRFHDTVSRGRVLNRFGRDFEVVDSHLSNDLGQALMLSLSAATSLVTIAIVVGWPFLLLVIILGSLYVRASKLYGQACRELRRLESTTRSPLYSLYGETISGVAVLRSFGASAVSMRNMLRALDANTNPFYWIWNANRWISTRFSLISSTIVGVSAMICLVTPSINASLAGFILAFASTVNEDILYAVRFFVQLEQSMIAVERIEEYTVTDSEAPEFTDVMTPEDWPTKGEIVYEHVCIRYAPHLKDALHDLSFAIKSREKIGVIGRTGSGKSTLALSLFRFIEASSGHIFIDDLDISKIGLTDLRRVLNIIPQDPTIVSGTLRSTMDVFGKHSDAEIYDALRRVHLISPSNDGLPPGGVTSKFTNLDANVSEAGDNFSAGEKQLLCMARALLKRAKILVMDEATASVDYATDEHIGNVIREQFAETTIITIAHRIRTVIDYDRVMVLEDGKLIEFERPAFLLQNSRSTFYNLCRSSGPEEFEVLRHLAGA